MSTSLILTIATIAIIIVVAIVLLRKLRKDNDGVVPEPVEGCRHAATGGCCGGINCERERKVKKQLIVYFEDEELDDYIGRAADSYTDEEVNEFSEVLHTLKENEVSPWLKSLFLRNIKLPVELAEEVKK